jgi:hypothetical protein
MITTKELQEFSKLLRYDILTSSTAAGSGHPTSSLSAVELMATLMYGGYYRYDFEQNQGVLVQTATPGSVRFYLSESLKNSKFDPPQSFLFKLRDNLYQLAKKKEATLYGFKK